MAKFDPLPKTSEWTDWKNIWHDWLRHRPERSSKIWFRKNFPGQRYTYPTSKGSSFFSFFLLIFSTFYALWWGCSRNGWTDFDAQYVIRRRSVRVRPFLEIKNIGRWPWPWKGQNPPFCLTLKILTRISRKRYEIERKCQKKLDRKSCMGFRMVNIFLTSGDLKRSKVKVKP